MNRKDIILRHIDKAACGIEIGPSHNPVAPKKDGYNVHIMDHLNREQLIVKYEGTNVENIEEVDFVWHGENYSDLTGKSKYYDWIIASHVIEHSPDFIGFLNNCDSILKNDGEISLVIPDKRYCFDHFRPITGISKIIDSHLQESRINSPGSVAEYLLNVVTKGGDICWGALSTGDYNFMHNYKETIDQMDIVENDEKYIDIHPWCFVPSSFRLLIHDLFSLNLIPFQEVCFHPTVGMEFFVTLSRTGNGINMSRLQILNKIETEVKNSIFSRVACIANKLKLLVRR